jgi:hypothetical protein
MRGGMVSTLGLARDTETSRHRQGRNPPIRANLALDRSPVLIGPIVASEGNGGRLGNYADPTAARLAGRCALLVGQRSRPRTRPTSCPHAFPQRQPRFIWPGRPPRATHVHVRSPDLRAGDGDDDIGRPRVRISGRRKLGRLIRPARARALSVFCFDRLFCGRIYERPVGQQMRAGRKLRGIDLTALQDVHDRNALRQ